MREFLKYRLHESLMNEIGDGGLPPYKWTFLSTSENTYSETRLYTFSEPSGVTYDVKLEIIWWLDYYGTTVEDVLSIDFSIQYGEGQMEHLPYDSTNRGNQYRVMSTIVDIAKNLIAKKDIDYIYWGTSNAKTSNLGGGSGQRNKLYTAYLLKYFPNARVINKEVGDSLIQIS